MSRRSFLKFSIFEALLALLWKLIRAFQEEQQGGLEFPFEFPIEF